MVIVRVPATTANLGPGFDVLGMALSLYNEVEIREVDEGLNFEVYGEGFELISKDTDNIVYKAAQEVFKKVGWFPAGLHIKLKNQIPVVRGLGSSAAALVAGAVAADYLSGSKLSKQELLEIVATLEGHPDNVAPALLGGLVVTAKTGERLCYRRLKPPLGLKALVFIPDYTLKTEDARMVLPENVTLADAVFNMGRCCMLTLAAVNNDLELWGQVMEDRLHQPYRALLVKELPEVIEAVKSVGSLGVALSGAGPTIIVFIAADTDTKILKNAIAEVYKRNKIQFMDKELYLSEKGAHIIRGTGA